MIRMHGERQRVDRFSLRTARMLTCTSNTAELGFFFSNPRDETRHAGQQNPDPGRAQRRPPAARALLDLFLIVQSA